MARHAIRPVIMSGGSGTRLWPVSRRARPKQFHSFGSDRTLFQQTILRFSPATGPFSPPVILGAASHEDLLRKEIAEIGVAPERIILEPNARNTGPAIAAMASAIERDRPGETVLVAPADHHISDERAFIAAIDAAADASAEGRIVTFGVTPTHPETGYGYIQAGPSLNKGAKAVAAFKEKPDLKTAREFVSSGDYFWNGGIFMFRTDVMLEEFEKHAPDIFAPAQLAVDRAERLNGVLMLDDDAFSRCVNKSIDFAVMEKTSRAAVAPIDAGWSDVGSWAAIWAELSSPPDGNAVSGQEAVLIDCRNTLAMSDGRTLAAIGLDDIVIVATPDAILVAKREASQDVKKVVDQLKTDDRDDLL